MIKRAVLFFVALAGILILASVAYLKLAGGDDKPQATVKKERTEPKEPWDGSADHVYNAAVRKRGVPLGLTHVEFTDLHLDKATVTAYLVTELVDGKAPEWLVKPNFTGFRPAANDSRAPLAFEPEVDGAFVNLKLRWQGVPTKALGPTCANPDGPEDPFFLRVGNLPGGDFAFRLNPPPLDECLENPEAVAANNRAKALAANGVSIGRVIVRKQTVTVSGRVNAREIESATLELGNRGEFSKVRTLPSAKGVFRARFRVSGSGPRGLRVRIEDESAGTVYPHAARRSFVVKPAAKKSGKKKSGKRG